MVCQSFPFQVESCGGNYNSPAGFIDFPVGDGTEYGHSLSCDYTITVEQGMVVSLAFTQFNLEVAEAASSRWK